MWRLWKFKISVDDRVRIWGLEGPSKYWCCDKPAQETLSHVFLRSFAAETTWSYFCSFAGYSTEGLNLREVIMLWWGAEVKNAMRPYYRVLPSFIIWELWRRRNKMKHEGKRISVARITHNVTRSLFVMLQIRKLNMTRSSDWPGMIREMETYCPKMKVKKVLWEFPPEGWVKYNTDGTSRGNPGLNSYALCLRDDRGDIHYLCRRSYFGEHY